jgi:hypothetical protein
MRYKFLATILFSLSFSHVFAWEIGERAYIYNAYNKTQDKKEFAMVEIDDIKGKRAKVRAIAACSDNGWAGKGCNTGWFINQGMQLNDTKWVTLDELLTSWQDKVK